MSEFTEKENNYIDFVLGVRKEFTEFNDLNKKNETQCPICGKYTYGCTFFCMSCWDNKVTDEIKAELKCYDLFFVIENISEEVWKSLGFIYPEEKKECEKYVNKITDNYSVMEDFEMISNKQKTKVNYWKEKCEKLESANNQLIINIADYENENICIKKEIAFVKLRNEQLEQKLKQAETLAGNYHDLLEGKIELENKNKHLESRVKNLSDNLGNLSKIYSKAKEELLEISRNVYPQNAELTVKVVDKNDIIDKQNYMIERLLAWNVKNVYKAVE